MPLYRFKSKLVFFVHIPKTGGTSVMKMLAEMGGHEALRRPVPNPALPCTPQHFHAAILRDLIPENFADLAFTVVRNPYDRLASEYRMKVTGPGRDVGFDQWVERTFRRYEKNPFVADNHIRPQNEFLLPGVRQYRFEQGSFAAIISDLAEIGIVPPEEVPWERSFPRADIPMTRKTADAISNFYQLDFQHLGYSPSDFGITLKIV
jgi:hypothetical protein